VYSYIFIFILFTAVTEAKMRANKLYLSWRAFLVFSFVAWSLLINKNTVS